MQTALQKALHYLGRFSRTTRQVANYLQRKGYSKEEIDSALTYLQERQILNDTGFAEAYIQSRIRRGDGPLKIKQLLFQKGIDSRTSDDLLKQHYPQEIQLERVAELLQRHAKKPREKLIRFVASRGFPRYVIIQALKNFGRDVRDT